MKENELTLRCNPEGVTIMEGKGGGVQQTRLVEGSRQPFPFHFKGEIIQRPSGNFNETIHRVWKEGRMKSKWVNSISNKIENVIYAKEKVTIPAWDTRLVKATSSSGVDGVCYISEDLPDGRISRVKVKLEAGVYSFERQRGYVAVSNISECDVTVPKQCALGMACEIAEPEAAQYDTSELHQDNINSTENINLPKTLEEKKQFIVDSFKLNKNEILNQDKELKNAVIQLFLDNFDMLALHSDHYGHSNLLQMEITLEKGARPVRSSLRPLNLDQKTNLRVQLDSWLNQGVKNLVIRHGTWL